jgi:hypothetical protein
MATQEYSEDYIKPFWDDSYKQLDYIQESFNDIDSVTRWRNQGYSSPFTGYMCDMRSSQPDWNNQFIDYFSNKGWRDIGTSYYRMNTGTVLPVHRDLYKKYVEIFDLKGRESTIYRAIIFLEDWQSGHYAEYGGDPYVGWVAGNVVEWQYDLPHMAANLGTTPRYTLQITGHV